MLKTISLLLVLFLGTAQAAAPLDSIVGVGMVIAQDSDGKVHVEWLVKNGPAEASGQIRPGDELLEVQTLPETPWVAVPGANIDNVVSLIRGEEGTLVGLQLQPADGAAVKTVTIKREKFVFED